MNKLALYSLMTSIFLLSLIITISQTALAQTKVDNLLIYKNVNYELKFQYLDPGAYHIKKILDRIYRSCYIHDYTFLSYLCQHSEYIPSKNINTSIVFAIEMITQHTSSISAEVILKSKSGRSMASEEENITAANIEEFRPAEETIKEAAIRLQELGFTVSQGGITLTILGKPILFEKVFKVKLSIQKEPNGGITVHPDRELSIPASLSNIVEKVEFVPAPTFFP
jgi:hypothetical protein